MSAPSLNDPQRAAVEHGDGPLLIFAGAGSGKTRVLTHRCASLLNQGVKPGQILLVTFTKKAAGEMRDRMVAMVGKGAKGLVAGTFHSVCAGGLRKRADLIQRTATFEIYTGDEQETVLKQVVEELRLDKKRYVAKELVEKIAQHKQKALLPSDVVLEDDEAKIFQDIWFEYEAWLRYGNALDFEDLIVNMMRLAERDDAVGEELRQRFRHVMVDEFQDTNLTQYRLVRAFGANGNLCVVGDDDQSVYQWRGADRSIILGFKKDFPDAKVVKLEQNYRSTKNIVASALGVISKGENREPKSLWTANPEGPRVALVECPDDRDEGVFVAGRIKQLVRAGVDASEIAVLYRSHSLSRPVEDELRLGGIPYAVIGGHSFYERKEVKDVLAYLRLAKNSDSDVDLMRVANRPVRGIGPGTLKKLREIAKKKKTSMFGAIEFAAWSPDIRLKEREQLGKLKELVGVLASKTMTMRPSDAAALILDVTRYKKMWEDEALEAKTASAREDADERAKNCDQVVESIVYYEKRTLDEGETPTVLGYLQDVALLTDQDRADATAKVSLMTVHAAKGLEFDFVFVVGFEAKLFPHENAMTPEEIGEERRLAYVAITRARRQLWITHCASRLRYGRVIEGRPSMFVEDLPADSVVSLTQFEYEKKERAAAMKLNVRTNPELSS